MKTVLFSVENILQSGKCYGFLLISKYAFTYCKSNQEFEFY